MKRLGTRFGSYAATRLEIASARPQTLHCWLSAFEH